MNGHQAADDGRQSARGKQGSGSDDVSAGNRGLGDGGAEPGATIIGSDAETMDGAGKGVRDATAPTFIEPPNSGSSAGRAAGDAEDDRRDADTHRNVDGKSRESGDSTVQPTYLQREDDRASSEPTLIQPQRPPQDIEDFFETLKEDSRAGTRSSGDVKGIIIGDYEVLRLLGRGGMGVVYQARHRKLDRIVALKMILAGQHAGDEAVRRFVAEARAVAHLQHPGIVQIFDIGEHKGLPYFSLEFVDGSDLHHDLAGQPRSAKSAAQMLVQLCEAMQYAHDNRILHRDLKPANILLDANGQPKITDFGLAKRVDPDASAATSDGTIMGSPSYMPPEQARGEMSSVTPRSDLYSLGAILYQMLTGRPPFLTDRPLDTVMQVIHNDPVQPRVLQPGIPIDLETICMKALQKDATARYASCREMAEDLRRFLDDEPILARPVSRLERAWRWCRRHPTIAVPSGLAGFFIIATAIISTWAWNQTSAQAAIILQERDNVRQQKDVAERERDEANRQRTIANQQKAVAEDNERIAQKQASLALQNIQFVVTDIDKQLRDRPGMSEIRIAMLEAVSSKWDELDVEMTGGMRGEAIPTLMAVRQLIAAAFRDLDRLQQAQNEFTKLEQMARERIALKGRTDSARTNLAKVLIAASPLARRLGSDPAAGIRALEESTELVREVLRDPQPEKGSPDQNEILQLLAASAQNLGVEYLREGRVNDTGVMFREALDAGAKVLEIIRGEPGFAELDDNQKDGKTAGLQIALDKSRIGLAYILLRLGKTDESIQLYEQAIASRREIYNRRSTMLVIKSELAGHLRLYGKSLLWLDRLADAGPILQEALKLSEESFEADPEKVDLKRGLSEALYFLGTLRDLQQHNDEALSLFERSRLLREQLNAASPDEKNQINLMLAEARVGNSDAARLLIDELAKVTGPNGELHLERARALSQLSRQADNDQLRSELQEQALTALERSVEEGYSDPFRISAEPDLDPLHQTDRFQLVVTKLQQAGNEK